MTAIRIPDGYTRQETTSREVCDFCGEPWSYRVWENSEVTIESKIGEIFGDSDQRTVQAFDCCPACWKSKVVPALTAIGGRVYEHEAEDSRLETMPFDPEAQR